MLTPLYQRAPPAEALARIEAWCRERFALAVGDVVMVSEVACSLPGCPPLETVVAFWTAGTSRPSGTSGTPAPPETPDLQRHHFKIFKRVAQVEPIDLPYAWQKPTLRSDSIEGGECC